MAPGERNERKGKTRIPWALLIIILAITTIVNIIVITVTIHNHISTITRHHHQQKHQLHYLHIIVFTLVIVGIIWTTKIIGIMVVIVNTVLRYYR